MEIDEDVLARAEQALGTTRTRDTVDAALRQVAGVAETALTTRVEAQRHQLAAMGEHLDLEVLRADVMWR